MTELELKYGCNPNQKPSRIYMEEGELPIKVLNGRPGYINFMDAFNSWQLVRELKAATGMASAASFKHVSPAGAAIGNPLPSFEGEPETVRIEGDLNTFADMVWDNLNEENKVSLYVSFIDLETGKASSIIRNKHC